MPTEFIRKLKCLGLTQKDIAEKCNISQQVVSKIEKGGSCDLKTAVKIADAFKISLDEVAGRETNELRKMQWNDETEEETIRTKGRKQALGMRKLSGVQKLSPLR